MISVLFLGFAIGMLHALEADHIAAVSSLATGARGARAILRQGVVWGIGHASAILLFAGGAIWLGMTIGGRLAAALELAVGLMLIGLGAHVIHRLLRDRVHFHLHRHGDGVIHVHAHGHRGETRAHDPAQHRHAHPSGFPVRALLVGLMHGMAGSAALLILTAAASGSPVLGMAQIVAFGLGSVLGMAALSAVIAVPLTYTAQFLTRARYVLEGATGAGAIALGLWTLYVTAPTAL
jgi:ABC-type nickel/cobalt efflux system permease component RcnA